ncbi:hypothetical protein CA85_22550 [Allorhodopirellula solitaria]|uniref:Uncharacterized protein n=1 Tax=Allorhodopirellula solitaria TaxID=2527987 RepID=A0A5C5XZM6_9BACT|nr:hypothetical protein CA85_22550 [Allorhodopirellula solitaria]
MTMIGLMGIYIAMSLFSVLSCVVRRVVSYFERHGRDLRVTRKTSWYRKVKDSALATVSTDHVSSQRADWVADMAEQGVENKSA